MIFDIYKRPSFKTSLFTENDGIFMSPHIAKIVPEVATDSSSVQVLSKITYF